MDTVGAAADTLLSIRNNNNDIELLQKQIERERIDHNKKID